MFVHDIVITRVSVVTGANKGLGLETSRKLASNGITVIVTARNEKNGTDAVEKLKASGLSDVVFHPLDVKDPASIDSLINNAGQNGTELNMELVASVLDEAGMLKGVTISTYEMAVDCLNTNYFGTKKVTEALLPLLQLSKSARIVNVTSYYGLLIVKTELSDTDNLSEEKIEEIVQWFLKDFKEDTLKANGWPLTISAYKVSKAAINAYTKLMAKKHPNILINCVHPGYVQTDITYGTGPLTPEEGARAPVMVALLPDNGPSGRYFHEMQEAAYYLMHICDLKILELSYLIESLKQFHV
ncbi:short-chain dehydrogenase/reductase 2b-like [Heracleum sosnowskyi]|uniref:Short-chain dehydrogenase/reductase 2b-like n=1 Tax=Heracleum sosnowskyi TaxID=360622 RepID=A0AAD8HWJ9_9APIA|nr:short-chain dehydrogenase/reductase 2b-like [Heracleum sosnowskyi]